MAYINDDAFDAALGVIDDANALYITSQEATTRTEAVTTYALGTKSSPSFTGPAAGDVSGRKITIDAITDGSVTGTGTATHWALVDGTRLLATGSLTSSQSVTSGNTFTLTAFDIEINDPS